MKKHSRTALVAAIAVMSLIVLLLLLGPPLTHEEPPSSALPPVSLSPREVIAFTQVEARISGFNSEDEARLRWVISLVHAALTAKESDGPRLAALNRVRFAPLDEAASRSLPGPVRKKPFAIADVKEMRVLISLDALRQENRDDLTPAVILLHELSHIAYEDRATNDFVILCQQEVRAHREEAQACDVLREYLRTRNAEREFPYWSRHLDRMKLQAEVRSATYDVRGQCFRLYRDAVAYGERMERKLSPENLGRLLDVLNGLQQALEDDYTSLKVARLESCLKRWSTPEMGFLQEIELKEALNNLDKCQRKLSLLLSEIERDR